MRVVVLAAVAVFTFSGAAMPEPTTGAPAHGPQMPAEAPASPLGRGPPISNPVWERLPTGDDYARNYPAGASYSGISGGAEVGCTVDAEGLLTDCTVVAEYPANEGFGKAALKISKRFKMKPLTRDGVPVAGGYFRTRIIFRVAG